WLKANSELFMPVLGYYYVSTSQKRYFMLFLAGIASYYLVGDKFTALVSACILFCIPIFLFSTKNSLRLFFSIKNILLLFVIVLMLTATIFYSYLSLSNGDVSMAIQHFYARILLQSQMWW